MKISVNRDKCCAAGQCTLTAPEVFDQDEEDGIVTLLDPTPPPRLHEAVREAADICPASVITLIEDEEGGHGEA